MTTEANDQPEPVIWFEGTLIRDPQPHGGQDDWLLETLADADGPKITIHASGEDHSANIRDNAHRGSRLMVKGTAGDEGSGIDIEATSLAFDPSHDAPVVSNDTDHRQRHQTGQDRHRRMDRHQQSRRPAHVHDHGRRRPFSIDADPAGMTIVTPLPPPAAGPDTEAAGGNDSKTGTDLDEGRITSRKTLYERFKTRLNENLNERKQ